MMMKDCIYRSRSFLKNIKTLLCKQKLVNNRIIPSTHGKRKIINLSNKHSFTPYPSLSSYSQTDRQTDCKTNTLAARGLEELFSSCAVVSVFGFWREIGFSVTYLCVRSTIQLQHCVSYLVLAGNSFWYYIRTQCTIHLCGCVSFLVVA